MQVLTHSARHDGVGTFLDHFCVTTRLNRIIRDIFGAAVNRVDCMITSVAYQACQQRYSECSIAKLAL